MNIFILVIVGNARNLYPDAIPIQCIPKDKERKNRKKKTFVSANNQFHHVVMSHVWFHIHIKTISSWTRSNECKILILFFFFCHSFFLQHLSFTFSFKLLFLYFPLIVRASSSLPFIIIFFFLHPISLFTLLSLHSTIAMLMMAQLRKQQKKKEMEKEEKKKWWKMYSNTWYASAWKQFRN